MPLRGLRFPLVGERVIIDPVGEVVAVEGVRADVDFAVARVGVVVLHVEHLLAPSVVDDELVVPVFVGIFGVDVRVEVLDGPHVVDVVAVGRDQITFGKIRSSSMTTV